MMCACVHTFPHGPRSRCSSAERFPTALDLATHFFTLFSKTTSLEKKEHFINSIKTISRKYYEPFRARFFFFNDHLPRNYSPVLISLHLSLQADRGIQTNILVFSMNILHILIIWSMPQYAPATTLHMGPLQDCCQSWL